MLARSISSSWLLIPRREYGDACIDGTRSRSSSFSQEPLRPRVVTWLTAVLGA